MQSYIERRVKAEVDSKHTTTDALVTTVDSKVTTVKGFTDTLESVLGTVANSTDTLESTAATIKGFTDSAESMLDTNESLLNTIAASSAAGDASESKQDTGISMLTTVKSYTDTVESVLGTVAGNVDGAESMLNTNETLLGDVKSQNDTNETLLGTVDSKVDTLQGFTDTVESQNDTNETLLGDVKSQNDTNESLLGTVKGYTDTVESVLGTVAGNVDGAESMLNTNETLLGDVKSQNDTNETLLGTVDSKLDTAITDTDGLESQLDTNESLLGSIKGSGFVATDSLKDIKAAVDAVQNNTLFTGSVVPQMETPEAGSNDYGVRVNVYDGAGKMEDPDLNTVLLKVENPSGTSRNGNLYDDPAQANAATKISYHTITDPTVDPTAGATYEDTNNTVLTVIGMVDTTHILFSWSGGTSPVTGVLTKTGGTGDATLTSSAVDNGYVDLEKLGTGRYESFYNVESADVEENLLFTFRYWEGGDERYYDRSSQVVDLIATATLDSISSQVDTNETLINTVDSKADTIKGYTDGVESMLDTNESLLNTIKASSSTGDASESKQDTILSGLTTIKGYTDTVESVLGTVAGNVDGAESMLDTNETLLNTVDSKVDTLQGFTDAVESQNDTNESLLNTIKTQTDTVESVLGTIGGYTDTVESVLGTIADNVDGAESMLNTNETLLNTVDSKIDTMTSAQTDNFAQFDEAIFLKTSGTLSADGNTEEEIATTNSQQTAYNDSSIMASKIIGQGMGSVPCRWAYVDIGWTGDVTDGGGPVTGDSKLMVVAGSTATVTGAVDLSSEQAETGTKANRWISGQIKLAAMNNLPFTVMLVGKVDNAVDTLVCTGFAGSSINVVHELA